MSRYVILLNLTEKGVAGIKESTSRAEAFKKAASKAGATVESLYWTLGSYDGVLVLSADDEATAVGLALKLGKAGNVRTTMLRAFDAGEFDRMAAKS